MESRSNSPPETAQFPLDENKMSISSSGDFSIRLEDLEDILLDGSQEDSLPSSILSSEFVDKRILSEPGEAASKRPSVVSYDGDAPTSSPTDEDEMMCEEVARSILAVGSFSLSSGGSLGGNAGASETEAAATSKRPSVVSHDGRNEEEDEWCGDLVPMNAGVSLNDIMLRSSMNSISISSKDFLPDFLEMESVPPIAPSRHEHESLHSSDSADCTSVLPAVVTPATTPSPSSVPSKKKRRRKERVLDLSRAVEPTDDDVLFGRGGYANIHSGNRRFRQEALELWPMYERSSKDEKQMIARRLVKSIKDSGGRFLERGKDGKWHEVIHGEHTKASQAFRDLHRRSR